MKLAFPKIPVINDKKRLGKNFPVFFFISLSQTNGRLNNFSGVV
jgi:hypothetical protein